MIPALACALLLLADPTEAVRARLQAYAEATRTYDAKALDAFLHPAYIEVSPLGDVDDRSRTLSFYTPAAAASAPRPDALLIEELTVRFPTRDVAVAVFRETAVFGAARRSFRATAALKKERAGWLLFSLQATGLRPAPKPSG